VTDDSPPLDRAAVPASLARNGVRFVLVGGLAAQPHGAASVVAFAIAAPAVSRHHWLAETIASSLRPRTRLRS
jgi:hypothetical protein